MPPAAYSFIDVAVLSEVRERFANGDALLILSTDLTEVIWVNGPGAVLLGSGDIEAVIGGTSGLSFAARRQIMSTRGYPQIGSDRSVTIRINQGMTSHALGLLASAITMPDGESAILLVAPAEQDPPSAATRASNAISGFTQPGHMVALLNGRGAIEAATDGFERLGITPQALADLVHDVSRERDRLVKKIISGAQSRLPAGIARLSDEPARHLLMVVDEEPPLAAQDEQPEAFDVETSLAAPQGLETAESSVQPEIDLAPIESASTEVLPEDDQTTESPTSDVTSDAADDEAVADTITDLPSAEFSQPVADGFGKDPTVPEFERLASSDELAAAVEPTVAVDPFPSASTLWSSQSADDFQTLAADENQTTVEDQDPPEPIGDVTAAPEGDASIVEGATQEQRTGSLGAEGEQTPDHISDEAATVETGILANDPQDASLEAAVEPAPEYPDPIAEKPPERSTGAVRFVWKTDADSKFSALSPEFVAAVGEAAGDVIGKSFKDVSALLGLDPAGDIAGLLERRDTWSGRLVYWPIAGTDLKVPVDLAALPVYSRDRRFEGFRGFGVARMADVMMDPEAIGLRLDSDGTIEAFSAASVGLIEAQDEPVQSPATTTDPFAGEVPALTIEPGPERRLSDKIIKLAEHRPGAPERSLSTVEKIVFREIGDRLKKAEAADTTVIAANQDPALVGPIEPDFFDADASVSAVEPDETQTDAAEPQLIERDTQTPDMFEAQPVLEADDDLVSENEVAQPKSPEQGENDDTPHEDTEEPYAPSNSEGWSELTPPEDEALDEVEAATQENTEGTEPYAPSNYEGWSELTLPEEAAVEEVEEAASDHVPEIVALPEDSGGHAEENYALIGRPGDESRAQQDTTILAHLPVPILIHSGDLLHYANDEFLDLTGYTSVEALADAGGLDALFADSYEDDATHGANRSLRMKTADGQEFPIEAVLRAVPWQGSRALMLVIRRTGEADAPLVAPVLEVRERDELKSRLAEMRTIIDTATDGVILIDNEGLIRSISSPAEALFGYETDEIEGKPFASLFAMESQRAARDYLTGLSDNGVASVLNDGREVIGREAEGRFIPLFMSIGRLPNKSGFCAVVRDLTQWKRAEEELTHARSLAERASSQKTEFLARISHEIRTPLNAIIGFSELMMDERFGSIGNERYRDYLRDINRSGNHVLDLVNDLLDISKIEAGEQEMAHEAVSLNETLGQSVAMMQPQANRERVIIRSSLASRLPDVVADLRSIRQIALNLLSNAIRYTQAGGQVIVSTSYEPTGDVVMRIRDTGIGMTQAEIEQAMKPFKQINALKRTRGDGTGLGLPLTKAMVEANRAKFTINSTPGDGTLVEVTFPATRVLAH